MRVVNAAMMREMQIAENVQMNEKKKKDDAKEKRKERSRMRQKEEAEKNRKKNKMMNWLVRRNMDDGTCGDMIDGESDVAMNVADVVGGLEHGKLENRKLEITTVGRVSSRRGNVGSTGNKGVGEEEGYG